MGKKTYHRDGGSRERGVKTLYSKVNIGAAGAPTLQKVLGILSIVRTGAGVYTCTIEEKFIGLLHVHMGIEGPLQDLGHVVTSDDVTSAGTIEVTTHAAGVATDPAVGTVLEFKIDVKDTSVVY